MKNTLFGFQPIISTSFSNDEIIRSIMALSGIQRFDCDCTYSTGVFWRNLAEPTLKFDLYPQLDGVNFADSGHLPIKSESISSLMFDPPFVIDGYANKRDKRETVAKTSNIIAKRFEGYQNFKELKDHYLRTTKEAYRVLSDGGIFVVKCQDTVSSGKNHFTHCLVMKMAMDVGFYPKDLYILLAKNTIQSGKWNKQHHARKHHSYFWVFQKTKCLVDYEF